MPRETRLSPAALLLPLLLFPMLNAPGPARGADPAKLLLTSKRGGNADIYLVNADGTDAKNLTNNAAEDNAPCWSPDGKQVVFASNRAGNRDIWVMDAGGEHVKQLTADPAEERTPQWSPDGKKIAFIRQIKENDWDIFVMDSDGANQADITNSPNWDADPVWSPDGKRLLYVSLAPGEDRFKFRFVEPDGAGSQPGPAVDNLIGWIYHSWSPDGKRVAYGGGAGEAVELFTCALDGSDRKQLTSLKGVNTWAAWSPDGKQLAFQHHDNPDGDGSLHLVDADGGNERQVAPADSPLEGGHPAWMPGR